MTANRILISILGVSSFVVIPIMFVTTFLLGILVTITFGLMLLPFSLVWILLLYPMLGLSRICHEVPVLRNIIGVIFIPWAVVANIFVTLTPSMGELESRALKLMLCEAWPYTWEFWLFTSCRLDPLESADPTSVALDEVITRMVRGDSIKQRVITRIYSGQQLDPELENVM